MASTSFQPGAAKSITASATTINGSDAPAAKTKGITAITAGPTKPQSQKTPGSLDSQPCLEISQDCVSAGRQDLIISHDSVKMTNRLSGLTLLFAPPYKEVVAYSDKAKRVFSCPYSTFKSPFAMTLLTFDAITFCNLPLKESERVDWQGMAIKKLTLPKSAISKDSANLPKAERRRLVVEATLASTAKFKIDPRAANFASVAYSLPANGSVPLKFDYLTMMETKSQNYLISSGARAVSLSKDTFSKPKNYQAVKSLELVTSDDVTQAGIEFMTGR